MAANTELFDGKYTVADLRSMIAEGHIAPTSRDYQSALAFMKRQAAEEASKPEAKAYEADQNTMSSVRSQWALWIAAAALLVSLGAAGLAVVALSESHIHAPAKP